MFYADDLELTGKSSQEVGEMIVRWKEEKKIRGLRVNMGKTKLILREASATELIQFG